MTSRSLGLWPNMQEQLQRFIGQLVLENLTLRAELDRLQAQLADLARALEDRD